MQLLVGCLPQCYVDGYLTEQTEEDYFVLAHDLGDVEVAQSTHKQRVFRQIGLGSLERSRNHQHRLPRKVREKLISGEETSTG